MRMFTNYHKMSEQAAGKRRANWLRIFLIAAVLGFAGTALLSVSGCGFKVRGVDLGFPFKKIAIQGSQDVTREVRRFVSGQPSTQIVEEPTKAEVVLIVVSQNVERSVVAFNSAGRPREIQLRTRVAYRITDGLGIELAPPQEISQTRDISVSESEALAMTSAEDFMQNDMSRDIAQQLVRRLRAVKLPAP
jgi:LPS-assembly lipoprotein